MKDEVDPMNHGHWLQHAPRCSAHSKRTGLPRAAPAVRADGVCRMHGARGGGPSGPQNGRWKHGLYSSEMVETRKRVAALVRTARDLTGEGA